ncbi:MAG: hypothetical protein IJL87_04465 [Clostridia bacterium]|nr:hypothetical protein [Clostridia bacterium]
MSKKTYRNPNIDLYDIEFDLNSRWEQMISDASKGKFRAAVFYSLCDDTHRFIEKYDKSKTVPHSAIALLELLLDYSAGDCYIENCPELDRSPDMAYSLYSLLTDGASDKYDIDYELCTRWDRLFEEVCEKRQLDLNFFQSLAADTFRFIKKYDKNKLLPHSALMLSKLMRNYCLNSYGYLKGDREAFVAGEIAAAFYEQLLTGLKCETDDDLRPVLTVEGNGSYQIDALTFDLTEAVKNCPVWVTDEKILQETGNGV